MGTRVFLPVEGLPKRYSSLPAARIRDMEVDYLIRDLRGRVW